MGDLKKKGDTSGDLDALLKSMGIDSSQLGTAAGATTSMSGVGTVYMPSKGGTSLVVKYNALAKKAQDIETSIIRATEGGGSVSGAAIGSKQQELKRVRAQLKSMENEMASAGGGGFQEMDYDSARLLPTGWTPAQLKEFVNKGIMYGIPGFDVGMGMPEIVSAWDDLVKASSTFSTGSKKWTPWDVMESYGGKDQKFGTMTKGDWVYDVATGERIKYVGKTTRTTTSEQIDLSSPEEIQSLVTQALREALGRAPTAKELATFKATITGYEKANPQVTTTTETATDESIAAAMASGGDVFTGAKSSSTTSGGVSDAARAELINAPVQDSQEYGKYQSGTTYWNAMMQMIGGG